jgi:DNA-binding NarL/FixJ family response regulator
VKATFDDREALAAVNVTSGTGAAHLTRHLRKSTKMQMRQYDRESGCEGTEASFDIKPWAPARIRIGWVSTSRLTRECMTDALRRAQPSLEIMQFERASDCIAFANRPPDVIVYHSRGHGVTDLQQLTELREVLAAVGILVMSDAVMMEPALIEKIMAAGTSGFLIASSNSLDMLLSAIRLVSSGGTFVPREFFLTDRSSNRTQKVAALDGTAQITRRERSVLQLIKHGKPNKTIAYELGLSLCTVKIHARNLIRKMGATNRTQVAVNADRFL